MDSIESYLAKYPSLIYNDTKTKVFLFEINFLTFRLGLKYLLLNRLYVNGLSMKCRLKWKHYRLI